MSAPIAPVIGEDGHAASILSPAEERTLHLPLLMSEHIAADAEQGRIYGSRQ
jgi:hypothetical protein